MNDWISSASNTHSFSEAFILRTKLRLYPKSSVISENTTGPDFEAQTNQQHNWARQLTPTTVRENLYMITTHNFDIKTCLTETRAFLMLTQTATMHCITSTTALAQNYQHCCMDTLILILEARTDLHLHHVW